MPQARIAVKCPHAKSAMTPCVIRDGPVCYAMDSADNPICVGCERPPEVTGVPAPPDWPDIVAQARGSRRPGRGQ